MTEWVSCPKCGALMIGLTGGHICPLCGYRLPVQTITYTTGTSAEYVQVIRCRDCKHYDGSDCDRYAEETYGISHSTQEYGYCWLAERKDE